MNKKSLVAFVLFSTVIVVLAAWALQSPEMAPVPEAHLPFYEEITAIKNRLTIEITEPGFTNPVSVCDFYELREEDSEDYVQTTVNYWVFQHGKQEHGDIEAFVEIYNVPDDRSIFTVEIARNCWNELTVSLDGSPVVTFPTVATDNELSFGYITFKVAPK